MLGNGLSHLFSRENRRVAHQAAVIVRKVVAYMVFGFLGLHFPSQQRTVAVVHLVYHGTHGIAHIKLGVALRKTVKWRVQGQRIHLPDYFPAVRVVFLEQLHGILALLFGLQHLLGGNHPGKTQDAAKQQRGRKGF